MSTGKIHDDEREKTNGGGRKRINGPSTFRKNTMSDNTKAGDIERRTIRIL